MPRKWEPSPGSVQHLRGEVDPTPSDMRGLTALRIPGVWDSQRSAFQPKSKNVPEIEAKT